MKNSMNWEMGTKIAKLLIVTAAVYLGMKYIFPKKMDKLIYGLDNIDLRRKYIIITEGVYDSLFLPNCVCVGGKSVSDIQLDILRKRYPNMKLYMSFDNDKPGIDSMKKSFKDMILDISSGLIRIQKKKT